MKNLRIAIIPLAFATLLSSCGGPNLGKEISHDEFLTKMKDIKPLAELKEGTKIKGKLHSYGYESDGSYKEETITLDNNGDDDTKAKTIIFLATQTLTVLGSFVVPGYLAYGNACKTYYEEGSKCLGLTIDYHIDATGGNESIKATYKWEEHGYPVYINLVEKSQITGTKEQMKPQGSEIHLECSYVF